MRQKPDGAGKNKNSQKQSHINKPATKQNIKMLKRTKPENTARNNKTTGEQLIETKSPK